MKVFVPVSQTGGVGKSTFSWNLSWRLAERFKGSRVLFIDATKSQGTRSGRIAPQAEIDGLGFGRVLNEVFSIIIDDIPFFRQQKEISDALTRASSHLKSYLVPVYGDKAQSLKIDVLPAASAYLTSVIKKKWHEPEEGLILGNLMQTLDNDYDFCVFDVTPDIGCVSFRSILRIADGVVGIESVKSIDTIQGISQLMQSFKDTQASFKGIVSNLYSPKRSQSKQALKILLDACLSESNPVIANVLDKASIANTTAIHPLESGIYSGLYAELRDTTNPSERSTLESFEDSLDRIIDSLTDLETVSIAQSLWDEYFTEKVII